MPDWRHWGKTGVSWLERCRICEALEGILYRPEYVQSASDLKRFGVVFLNEVSGCANCSCPLFFRSRGYRGGGLSVLLNFLALVRLFIQSCDYSFREIKIATKGFTCTVLVRLGQSLVYIYPLVCACVSTWYWRSRPSLRDVRASAGKLLIFEFGMAERRRGGVKPKINCKRDACCLGVLLKCSEQTKNLSDFGRSHWRSSPRV